MSPQGTAAYDGLTDLPPLVERAVDLARRLGFANSCRPEHGRLLRALAAGAGTIGETGTGCGVGLAWLASGARSGTRLVSVEIDTERAGLVASLFADLPHLAVIPGDWREDNLALITALITIRESGWWDDFWEWQDERDRKRFRRRLLGEGLNRFRGPRKQRRVADGSESLELDDLSPMFERAAMA